MRSYSEQFEELSRQMKDLGSGLECRKSDDADNSTETMIFIVSDTTSNPTPDFSRYAELA